MAARLPYDGTGVVLIRYTAQGTDTGGSGGTGGNVSGGSTSPGNSVGAIDVASNLALLGIGELMGRTLRESWLPAEQELELQACHLTKGWQYANRVPSQPSSRP